MFKTLKKAVAQELAERQFMLEALEQAQVMDTESEEYQKVKQEVEAFLYFRPHAKMNDFMERYIEIHGEEENLNLFLPIVVASKLNVERSAREAMEEHVGNLEEALKAFLEVRKNASPKTFFEEYRAFDPEVTKDEVVSALEKLNDEAGLGRVFTELWIEKPLSREEAEEAGREAVAEFAKKHPEAAEFLKVFHFKVSDLTIEETFDLATGESLTFDKDEVEELLHRKFYDDKDTLIESEQESLEARFEEWTEAFA